MKVVELSVEDFQKLIQEIKDLKLDIQKLQSANDFLNSEIEDFNIKFGDRNPPKGDI